MISILVLVVLFVGGIIFELSRHLIKKFFLVVLFVGGIVFELSRQIIKKFLKK
jgi:hypothetical protein